MGLHETEAAIQAPLTLGRMSQKSQVSVVDAVQQFQY